MGVCEVFTVEISVLYKCITLHPTSDDNLSNVFSVCYKCPLECFHSVPLCCPINRLMISHTLVFRMSYHPSPHPFAKLSFYVVHCVLCSGIVLGKWSKMPNVEYVRIYVCMLRSLPGYLCLCLSVLIVCVCACVRACVRACVCVCVCAFQVQETPVYPILFKYKVVCHKHSIRLLHVI